MLSRAWARASHRPSCDTFQRSALAFNNTTPLNGRSVIKSINITVDQYRSFLEQVRTDPLVLPNYDLDSGKPTKAAEYSLTDDSYAKLLAQLSQRSFSDGSPTYLAANRLPPASRCR